MEKYENEFAHQLEYKLLDNKEYPTWNRLNQKNFLYQNNYNYHGNKNKFQGFVSDYASKNISEDVAETFFHGLVYLAKKTIKKVNILP